MANIDTYLEQIANGEYGRDVRDAIHDALEAINDSIPNSTSVSQEVISARTPGDQGLPPYDNLKQRLDTEAETLLDQAEQLATPGIRANIQITNATVGYSSLKDRLDTEYADLNRKVGRVIGRAEAAVTSAEDAVTAANQAKTSAESAASTATSKATEAASSASTATSKASEASSAAANALSNAQSASGYASNASTSASNAAFSANEAVTAAQQAQQASQSLVVDATLTQQGKPADAKKVGDELTDLKGDLINEIFDSERVDGLFVDGYDASNANSAYMSATPFVYNISRSGKWKIKKVKINVSNAGTLSIGTVKRDYIQVGAQFDRSDFVVKSILTIASTGEIELSIPNPITVEEDEYLFIGMPTDTVSFLYGPNGTEKGFVVCHVSGEYRNNASSLGLTISGYKEILYYKSISRFYGKRVSIIGDSIDTFDQNGYKIDGYNMWYPKYDVTSVEQTWWKQVIDESGAALEVNASWSGSRVTNTHPISSYPDFYDRVSVIGSPDIIFVTLGTNDSTNNIALGDYDFETVYTSLSEATFRTAYIKGMKALQALYPNAVIVAITEQMKDDYKESIQYICSALNIDCIDASDYIGTSGVHPGAVGMGQIARLVLFPTDETLNQHHMPADAKTVGRENANIKTRLSDVELQIEQIKPMLSDDAKIALLDCFKHVAWIDQNGQAYYDTLEAALSNNDYPKLIATFNPGVNVIYADDALDTLKQYLVVKQHTSKDASTTIPASDYTLSGILKEGDCVIRVSYNDIITSFSVKAVDFYNIYEWSTQSDLSILNKSPGYYQNTCGYDKGVNNARRSFWTSHGKMGALDSGTSTIDTTRYPIPVPSSATKAKVTVTNISSAMFAIVEFKYIPSEERYSRNINGNWKANGTETTLYADTDRFITVNLKTDSSGSTAFSVEPSIIVEFS